LWSIYIYIYIYIRFTALPSEIDRSNVSGTRETPTVRRGIMELMPLKYLRCFVIVPRIGVRPFENASCVTHGPIFHTLKYTYAVSKLLGLIKLSSNYRPPTYANIITHVRANHIATFALRRYICFAIFCFALVERENSID